ncbi:MAG: tRNA glutamyl-Q(34) synthetase GluQRS [Acidimicrobiales bacterium]
MPVGRFAPSPTGALHVGNLRTALLAWLLARSNGAAFLLRVEDLDPATARPEHEAGQRADLAALGLDHDGPVVRQSDRRAAHAAALDTLVAAGLTYACWCSRREVQAATAAPHGRAAGGRYPGTCRELDASGRRRRAEAAGRPPALRLRAGGEAVTVVDRFHGPVTAVVDDLVLRRGDGLVAYNLAVVVDDADQGVEEVVRGDDLVAATPAQALLCRLLGLPAPAWAHVPLLLGPDGARLAKRNRFTVDGRDVRVATTVADLRALGWGPPDVVGALAATLGLAPPGEPRWPGELLAGFDPAALPRAPTTWAAPVMRDGAGPAGS